MKMDSRRVGADVPQGEVHLREQMPGDGKAVRVDLTPIKPFLPINGIEKRAFAAGQISDLVPFCRLDAVQYPLTEGVRGKKLPLLNFFLCLGKIVIIPVFHIIEPMQAAHPSKAVINFLRRQSRNLLL